VDLAKELVGATNNAADALKNVDLSAQMNKEKAKESLGESILDIGVGVILDGVAAKNAADLLQEAQTALKQVSFGDAGKVKEVVNVDQFVAKEIPPQASSLQQFSAKLVDYAKTNGIPTRSPEEAKKKAAALLES